MPEGTQIKVLEGLGLGYSGRVEEWKELCRAGVCVRRVLALWLGVSVRLGGNLRRTALLGTSWGLNPPGRVCDLVDGAN